MKADNPTPPAEGERRAVRGYRGQYSVAAVIVLKLFRDGVLESLRIADPDAGRVDDFVCLHSGVVDAYQVKWSRYPGRILMSDLRQSKNPQKGLLRDLADGWLRLRDQHPGKQIRVHLVSNDIADPDNELHDRDGGQTDPTHLAAFLKTAWPAHRRAEGELPEYWLRTLADLRDSSGLSQDDFETFSRHCYFDLGFSVDIPTLPWDEQQQFEVDRARLGSLFFDIVGDQISQIELTRAELLERLGWSGRANYRNKHQFPTASLYEPIDATVAQLIDRLQKLTTGYVAVVGSPGSGKSTLLSESLRNINALVIPYYAFIPGVQDIGPIRGEAESFLHDVCLALYRHDIRGGIGLLPTALNDLRSRLGRQLTEASSRYEATGQKLILLIDGLDHIPREQSPHHSLIHELPDPRQLPSGVLLVLGSQRTDFLSSVIQEMLRQDNRRIEIEPMSRDAMLRAVGRASLKVPLNEEQLAVLLNRVSGHPLALGYLLNRLGDLRDVTDIDALLDSETRYHGDIDLLYRSHWDQVANDVAVVALLGRIARWDGVFDIKWFASWCGRDTGDAFLHHFKHFLRRDTGERWTLFHNSFRLFLLDRTSENMSGDADPERHRQYYRDLLISAQLKA